MRNSETPGIVATMELLVACIDTTTRKSTPIPDAVIQTALALLQAADRTTQSSGAARRHPARVRR